MATLGTADGGQLSNEWAEAEIHLQRALDYALCNYPSAPDSHRTLAQLRTDAAAGKFTLLRGRKSALLVEVHRAGAQCFLGIVLAGGDIDEVSNSLRQKAEALAKRKRCHAIIIGGRKGWARALKRYGYRLEGPIQDTGAWLTLKPLGRSGAIR